MLPDATILVVKETSWHTKSCKQPLNTNSSRKTETKVKGVKAQSLVLTFEKLWLWLRVGLFSTNSQVLITGLSPTLRASDLLSCSLGQATA